MTYNGILQLLLNIVLDDNIVIQFYKLSER